MHSFVKNRRKYASSKPHESEMKELRYERKNEGRHLESFGKKLQTRLQALPDETGRRIPDQVLNIRVEEDALTPGKTLTKAVVYTIYSSKILKTAGGFWL